MTRTRIAVGLDVVAILGVYAVSWLVLRTQLIVHHPEVMGLAITADLVLTSALVHYALGVRLAGLPKWTVSVVAAVGAVTAVLLVPGAETGWLIGGLLGLVELALAGFVAWRGLALLKEGRRARRDGAPLLDAVEAGLAEALESTVLAGAAVAELRIVGLSLTGAFRRAPTGPGVFTAYRENGWSFLSLGLLAVCLVEVPVLHIVLEMFVASWVAWVVTALSVYGVLWLWGDSQALRLHPTRVDADTLHLHMGMRWRASIPLAHIEGVERTDERAEVDVSVLGEPDLVLVLRRPVTVHGMFGIRRTGDRISLQVDDPEGFAIALGHPL